MRFILKKLTSRPVTVRRTWRPKSIPRAQGVSDRVVGLALAGRFTDELLGGLPDVLMPTIQRSLGLRFTQVGLLALALNYVAVVVESISGLLTDVWERRWLLAWGATVLGGAVIVMGAARAFPVLLLGFALYGLASGPLAHTADVVLVEAHPQTPGRIFARATSLDTVGAMLAPLLVAAAVWAGLDWRWLLAGAGATALGYGALLAATRFPRSARHDDGGAPGGWSGVRQNIALVLSSRAALAWLAFLFAFDLVEAPLFLKTIWLAERVGMSQGEVALYRVLEMAIVLVSLLWLDRWLVRATPRRLLAISIAALIVLFPAWLLIPGVWSRVLLAFPLNFFQAMIWPIAKSESLSSVPGHPGTVTAVNSLFGLAPLTLGVGALAELWSLTAAMLVVIGAGLALMALVLWRVPAPGDGDADDEVVEPSRKAVE
ncbi:MAG: MFS transporter [Dehalococcoidia bacterium]|jgi:MFS family permease|nr:MFS transporter [Dehalococcoidia bacterium]